MAGQEVGLDQGEVGKRAGCRVPLELGEGDEAGGEPVLEARDVDDAGDREGVRLEHVDLPGPPRRSSRSKIVSAVLWKKSVAGRFTTKPEDVAAVQKDRLGNVCEGTSLNQWSKTAKPRAIPLSTGT